MPNNIKCLMIFESNEGYGWTETHTIVQPGQNFLPQAIALVQKNLIPKRQVLLGGDCRIVNIRCSTPLLGTVASLNQEIYAAGTGQQPSTSQNDSLAIQMINGDFTRKKIIHLRGFWASVVVNESYSPPAGSQFPKLLAAYLNALIAPPFGWVGKEPTSSVFGVVTGFTVQPSGQLLFTCAPTAGSQPLSALTLGGMPPTFECRFSRINNSRSVLNRTFVVTPYQPVTPGVVTGLLSTQVIAAAPLTGQGRFNISIPFFLPYQNAGNLSLGERRMGKVLDRYPGRRTRRPVS